MKKALKCFILAAALILGFTSCDGTTGTSGTSGTDDDTTFTVTYSTNFGTAPESVSVEKDSNLTSDMLPELTLSGYTFGGWYVDNVKVTTEYRVSSEITIEGKFMKTLTDGYATIPMFGSKVCESIGDSKGGPFGTASDTPVTVENFYIAETELTYTDWYEVYTWAINNGYTFANMGREGTDLDDGGKPSSNSTKPVTNISWRDAVIWCNAASEKNDLTPVYWIEGTTDFTNPANILRTAENYEPKEGETTNSGSNTENTTYIEAGSGSAEKAVVNKNANGYRLPTEAEWEYAARGGDYTADGWSYTYPGTNDKLGDYAVYYENGNKIANVKTKKPNGAGLYDMSGNVYEWCYDVYEDTIKRCDRGGSFHSSSDTDTLKVSTRNSWTPCDQNKYTGLRVVRN